MKLRSLFLSALCALSVGAVFTSCSDDDDDDAWKEGSKVELAQTRAFILNEGAMGANNANLTYFDWSTNTPNPSCIYTQQNGQQLGDTGNDIITFEGKLAVAVNGSNYVTLLNGSAVELSRVSFAQGVDGTPVQVRNLAFADGHLYVSTYGGLLLKIRVNGNALEFNGDYVSIGTNMEGICAQGGKLYCVVAGAYPENDSRVAVVPVNDFKTEAITYTEVMYNPDNILAVDGHVFVQGYGPYYDYPFGEINTTTGEYLLKGNATAMAGADGALYIAYSLTDWNTYATTTSLSRYDLATGKTDNAFFTKVPEEITTSFVYSISVNPYTGDIYVATSDYTTNGLVFVFNKKGEWTGNMFSAGGLNPNKIVFLK